MVNAASTIWPMPTVSLLIALAVAPVSLSPPPPSHGAVAVSVSARAEIVTLEQVRPQPPRSDPPQLQRQVDRATATIQFY